jgi:shikimate dehydrogenase
MLGLSRRCAVIGHPIAHSLSPTIHRAAYRYLGLDWSYQGFDVPPGGLAEFVAGLGSAWRGLSVTMPHKAALLEFGAPDEFAALTGAANTLILDAEPKVYNTDIPGAVQAMRARGIEGIEEAIVLGAGSTAKSLLVALSSIGVRQVRVQLRDLARGVFLVELADQLGVEIEFSPLGLAEETALLVNTLPPGVADPFAEALVVGADAVFDVSYDPWPTRLAGLAQAAGLRLVSGLDLLCAQALGQIELMTGHSVPVESLLKAAEAELAARAQR